MRTEKLIKREDGTQIKIEVSAWMDRGKLSYDTSISTKAPRKRKWDRVRGGDNWDYRQLSMEDKLKWEYNLMLTLATEEELQSVRLELWESMKPEGGK
jgi:hypothetical protein